MTKRKQIYWQHFKMIVYVLLSVLTQPSILGKHSRKVTNTLLNMFHNSLILRVIKKVDRLKSGASFWLVTVCSQPWNKT